MVIPLVLLLVVLLLGFVSCDIDIFTGPPTHLVSDAAVFDIPGVIAFWRLAEAEGETVAPDYISIDDPTGPFPGTYTPLANPANYDSANKSAAVSGTITGGAQPIVFNSGKASVSFDGGFVTVPFDPALNPAIFTIAVAVSPDWALDPTQPAFRVVIESGQAEGTGAETGFVLRSNLQDQWEAGVGNGGVEYLLATGPKVTTRNAVNFLIVICTGNGLSLYVDSNLVASTPVFPAYRPAISSDLRIGSGSLSQSSGTPGAPVWPFQGRMASLVMYDRALTVDEIELLSFNFLVSSVNFLASSQRRESRDGIG
jgi:hypothetical protein